jgi:hypothetical protein
MFYFICFMYKKNNLTMRKIYLLFCLFLTEIAYAQSKWESGLTVGGCFNVMSEAKVTGDNFFTAASSFGKSREWTFQHQAGLVIGVSTKRTMTERFSIQAELNIVWSRQKADFNDELINDPNNMFLSVQQPFLNKGYLQFNTVYLQFPFIVTLQLDAATSAELGVFGVRSLSNKSSQALTTLTASTFDPKTGQLIFFPTPQIIEMTTTPNMTSGSGWLLGLHYRLNKAFAVRMRYEGGMSRLANFNDLKENRLMVGMIKRF